MLIWPSSPDLDGSTVISIATINVVLKMPDIIDVTEGRGGGGGMFEKADE